MGKIKKTYKCSSCDATFVMPLGRCNNCKSFGTVVEVLEEVNNTSSSFNIGVKKGRNLAKPITDVKNSTSKRILTNIGEVDRLFGGGFVEDSISIISAPPGTGKSTLTLLIANNVSNNGYKVLYATGEESEHQVKGRADRLIKKINSENLYMVATNSLEDIICSAEELDIDLLIVDSLQTINLSHIEGRQGGNKQTLECSDALTKFAKDKKRPRCVLLISQMTKDEEIKGSNELQHLVDTLIVMKGEDELKTCYTLKNRFGPLEVSMFKHTDNGFEEVSNPSAYFITERAKGEEVTGSALSVIKEGTRPIIIEVESSVSKSFTPFPSRLSQGFKKDTLNILISILEEKSKVNLFDKNVIISSTGGLNIKETSVELALIMSIVSSVKKIPIDSKTIFVGEVGLTGEIKKVSSLEVRIKEADRLGFEKIIIPNQEINLDEKKLNIKVEKYKNINTLIKKMF